MPLQPLVPDAIPTTGFRKWVTTILSTTQVAQNVIILALLFIYRLKDKNPSVRGKPGSEYRLLTVALMLGNKCACRHLCLSDVSNTNGFGSPRRQHLYEQDLGRGLRHIRSGSPYHGSGVSE